MADIIEVSTPLYQVEAGAIYKLNIEGSAANIVLSDGQDIEARITLIEKQLGANASMWFAQSVDGLSEISGVTAGDQALVTTSSGARSMYVYLPDNTWLKLYDIAAGD